jgi:cellulose biosynthesis protein BcsQ
MTKVVAVYNIKGGVGKTSAAVNLAWLAAAGGARTLLWDLDPQGAATFLMRIKPKVKGGARKLIAGKTNPRSQLKGTDHELLDMLPADFSYRNMDLELEDVKRPTRGLSRVIAPIAKGYDYVFLDCPPQISLASESIFGAAQVVLVPLIPSPLSLRTFDQLQEFLASEVSKPPRVLAFFSMVDGRKRLHREVIEELSAAQNGVLSAVIPAATDVERMSVNRRVLAQTAPRSRAGRAYEALWLELREKL